MCYTPPKRRRNRTRGWSYRPDGRTRSFEECVQMLASCATGDGNLLLNVGPLPTGEIAAEQQAVVRQIGAWLVRHGESIYATRGGPFRNGEWGGATFHDKAVYLHVFRWTGDTLRLPPLKAKVLRVVALTGGEPRCEQTPGNLIVTLPEAQQDKTDSIIKLEVDAPAAGEFVNGKPLEVSEPAALRLDSPLDYQVFQRRTRTEGIVRVSGRAPEGTEKAEVQFGGDWLPVEFNTHDGTFRAEVKMSPGGWHVCRTRATGKGKLLGAAEVPHVGVGEVFVVAGQSNSADHGAEKQKTKTGLVAAFDGKRWRPANDPQPGASGGSGRSSVLSRNSPAANGRASVDALITSLRMALASESVSRLPEITAADTRHSPCRPRMEFSGRTGGGVREQGADRA
ncbi:MAG: alpha-L-fucosidase [Planctomycetota bacterium]|nr:alpha-L-fucosidase [Planctomycetota bacterium]